MRVNGLSLRDGCMVLIDVLFLFYLYWFEIRLDVDFVV